MMRGQLRRSSIVSNSGTMFTASSPPVAAARPPSTSSATSRTSETALAFEIT